MQPGGLHGQATWLGRVSVPLPTIDGRLARYQCRNNALAFDAFLQIEGEVREAIKRFGSERIGVVVGTTTSGVEEANDAIAALDRDGQFPATFHYSQLEYGGLAEFLASAAGSGGPAYVISTACSSSAKAIASARTLIDSGLCDAVITGGVDSLARLTVRGFSALEAVSSQRTLPFSRNRNGLNLGEAAALFLMTRDAGGIQLSGVGESTDAHHMSAPNPTGEGAECAIRSALNDADLQPDQIAYLNLHGTGTILNDSSEANAVSRVFGCTVPCSSTKPRVGHTLGAAGALEAAFCWLVMTQTDREIELPPHDFDGEYDPALAKIRLVESGNLVVYGARFATLTNSFGFGGNNCCLVLEREVNA